MAATIMGMAVEAVLLLYYVVSCRIASAVKGEDSTGSDCSKSMSRSVKKRLSRRPAQAPVTWLETIYTLSETLRFTYAETLGKWPIADLAFGINYLIRRVLAGLEYQVAILLSWAVVDCSILDNVSNVVRNPDVAKC